MQNIDKKGKKETKLELLLTFGVLSSQNLHPNSIFNLNRGHFARNECEIARNECEIDVSRCSD